MKKEKKHLLDFLKKKEINGDELQVLLAARDKNEISFVLIDVREQEEYDVEKIDGVDDLIPTSEFYQNNEVFKQVKKNNIILQCRSGIRSYNIQQTLKNKGYQNVINLSLIHI